MASTIAINDTLILDQTAGIQDDDGALAADLLALATPFRTALFALAGSQTLSAGQLAYAASAKGAFSSANYVTVNPDGATINDLFFSDPDGNAFSGDQVFIDNDPLGDPLQTVDGDDIYLWSLGDGDIVIATTSDQFGLGEVVAAFYLNDAADNLSATIEMVTFIPLDHPDDTNPDDRVDWSDLLNVTGTGSLFFDFDALKSGSSLWVAVGSESAGILVTGGNPVVDGSNKKTNASDVIHTSQGGTGATIGVNNQLFDVAGEKGVFTLVTGLDTITGDDGATGDYTVDPNLNDNKREGIDYDGYLNVTGAGIFISQSQGSPSVPKDLDINLFTAGGGTTPEDLTNYIPGLTLDTAVNVGSVTVINDDGEIVGVWGVGGVASGTSLGSNSANGITTVTVSISGNNIDVDGVLGEFTVRWTSLNGVTFNRFTMVSEAGKFDVGGVEITQGLKVTEPVGDTLFVDDDGPTVDLVLRGTAEVRVDETTLPAVDSIIADDLFSTNFADFGTDGPGTDDSVYKLLLGDDNSGLFDTATNQEVILTVNAAGTLITGTVNSGANVVFTIAIDPDTGEVTLTQSRAMKNGDPTDPDESDTPLTLATGLVRVERTIKDGDDDSASDNVDISPIFKFEDAGPTIPGPTQALLELTTDDTDILDSDTLATDDIFPGAPTFGSDGPHATTPIVLTLKLSAANADSGLVDTATGRKILFKVVGSDIVGFVDSNNNNVIDVGETTEAIRYNLSADGETVTFSQSRAVFHALADTEKTVAANTVTIERKAIDGDGDTSEVVSFDLGVVTHLLDDVPTIGPIANSIVDLELNDTVTKTLNGDVNNDPNASPYILTAYTASVNVGGVDVHGVLAADAKSVKYWADTNGDTIFGNDGDTGYFELTLSQTDNAGAGSYTFTVLIDPPPAISEFDFTDLPSGQNLFGAIAQDKADLDGLALFVIAKNADVNDPGDGQMTNTSATVNTSKGGGPVTIGNTNQMIDPLEGEYFVYLSNADTAMIAGVPGGLTQNTADDADTIAFESTQTARTAQVEIVQVQGGGLAAMDIKAYDIDMVANYGPDGVVSDDEARDFVETPLLAGDDPVNIMSVKVYNASGVLVEHWADPDLNGTYTLQAIPGNDDHAQVDVDFFETSAGSGIYYARVFGINDDYMIEFETETDHDMALVEGFSGKFDIGGFNIIERQDIEDTVLEFTAQVKDGDNDTATSSWKIGIDGTGDFNDNLVSGVIV